MTEDEEQRRSDDEDEIERQKELAARVARRVSDEAGHVTDAKMQKLWRAVECCREVEKSDPERYHRDHWDIKLEAFLDEVDRLDDETDEKERWWRWVLSDDEDEIDQGSGAPQARKAEINEIMKTDMQRYYREGLDKEYAGLLGQMEKGQ
jgi:hypothetical protein